MREVLASWNLSDETVTLIKETQGGNSLWDIGGAYILKHNPDTQRTHANIALANLLLAQGVSTTAYVKTIDDAWTTPDGHYSLYHKLTGAHMDFTLDKQATYNLGKELAKLHEALLGIAPQLVDCHDNDYLAEWEGYIKPGLVGVSLEIIDYVERHLPPLYQSLPRQPIHRDVHSQNVLFHENKLTGWLDFELSRRDVRVFDIAYLMTGLILDRINDPAALDVWNQVYTQLIDGYASVSPLSASELTLLPVLMVSIELLFVTYWESQGNVEQKDKALALAVWLHQRFDEQLEYTTGALGIDETKEYLRGLKNRPT